MKKVYIVYSILLLFFYAHSIPFKCPYNLEETFINRNLLSAGYWNLIGVGIQIDGNDDWATINATNEWCNGKGTWNDPYVLENITIDGQDAIEYCIIIQNTDVPFIINNCTLINAQYDGIIFVNVSHPTLTKNKIFSNTRAGMILNDCFNGTIQRNTITGNGAEGIMLGSFAYNNTIERNQISSNVGAGISINLSENNTVSMNLISNNGNTGIDMYDIGNNIISLNNISYHHIGILYSESNNNEFKSNYIIDNNNGMSTSNCYNNNFIGNFFYNIPEDRNIDLDTNNNYFWNAFYGFVDPFIISNESFGDLTWSEISTFAWGNGSGTMNDPYIIENIQMDNRKSIVGSRITINGSTNHFIIKGCSLTTEGEISGGAGIELIDVKNGVLTNNYCSEIGGTGIKLDKCWFITIQNNQIDNNVDGIHLFRSNSSTISNNTINNNNNNSIILVESNLNFINLNRLSGNEHCIIEVNCSSNTIIDNICIMDSETISGYYFSLIILVILIISGIQYIRWKKK